MMTAAQFITFVLSFPGTEQKPHFDRTAFKVAGKRNFATLHEKSKSINVKLSAEEQKAFCDFAAAGVYPVPNKWGEQGWTTVELNHTEDELIKATVESAYNDVVKPKERHKT